MRVLNIEAICTYSKPSKELIEVTENLSHLLIKQSEYTTRSCGTSIRPDS